MINKSNKLHILWGLCLLWASMGSAGLRNTAHAQSPTRYYTSNEKELLQETAIQRVVTLRSVLEEIERSHNISFLYDIALVDHKFVSVSELSSDSLANVLGELLLEKGLTYKKQTDRTYVIMEKQSAPTDVLLQELVSGNVTDAESGEPLPGVNVVVKGTTIGTATGADGIYSLNVPGLQDTLVFSFIGYQTREIPINGRTEIDVALQVQAMIGEELVVVGYGTLEAGEVTSSITSLSSEDMISGVSTNPLTALQGKVTGLSIVSNNGTDPNAGVSLQLRGVNSVNASQGPLIVIDGVPGGNLNTIAREDIKSIDVLKDASAAAIYGTRASGGVILITTEDPGQGPLRVSYSGEVSTETIRRRPDVLSSEEFIDAGLGSNLDHNTDWYDEVTNDLPFTQRHNLSLAGGNETTSVYASAYTKDAQGMAIGSARNEYGGRLNTNFQLFDGKAILSSRISYAVTNADFSNNDIFEMALKLNPTETPYDPQDVTGYNVWTGGYDDFNPVADVMLRTDENQYKNFLGNLNLTVNLTPNWSTSAMVAFKNDTEHFNFWRSAQHKTSREEGINGYAKQEYKRWEDQTFEWLTTYGNDFGQHGVKLTGGYSFQQFGGQGFWADNSDFPVDGVRGNDLNTGSFLSEGRADLGSWKDPRERLIAFFGRVNYDFKNRYLLSASVRHEGSSKFAAGNQWGTFPAISVGWRISDEPFMDGAAFIDDLKLRGGYGVTGNAGFSPGVATRMYGPDTWWLTDGEWVRTYGVSHNQNTGLQWETKKEFNVGLDFILLDQKLSGKVDLYHRNSDRLIYDISVSQPPAIHDKTTMNVGSLVNKGWEAELTWDAVSKTDLSYSTTLRASHNTSTLSTLWGSQTFWDRKGFPAPGSPGNAVRLYPGEDIGKFFVWKFAGITDEGNWMLYDESGEPFDVTERSKTIADKQFTGNAIPKLILSWNHTMNWKNFDFSVYLRSWLGHDVFNMINMYYGLSNVSGQNVLKDAYEQNREIRGEKELSDYWLEDGDFLKLDAVTLGYSFNVQSWQQVRSIRMFVTGRNLLTITGYSGMDPEVNINGLDPGFEELNVYPRTRVFTLGVQANF